eukprot:8178392-Pyramimonas_sp.AAC.1
MRIREPDRIGRRVGEGLAESEGGGASLRRRSGLKQMKRRVEEGRWRRRARARRNKNLYYTLGRA